jgi:hypothetical protein
MSSKPRIISETSSPAPSQQSSLTDSVNSADSSASDDGFVVEEGVQRIIQQNLTRAKWQLEAPRLARALLYKTPREDVEPLWYDEIDGISLYNVRVNNLSEEELADAAKLMSVFSTEGLNSKQDHYPHVARFLNNCLAICREIFPASLASHGITRV